MSRLDLVSLLLVFSKALAAMRDRPACYKCAGLEEAAEQLKLEARGVE